MKDLDSLSLFDRLPDKIFRPLSGKNQRLYWGVLENLFEDFFKGDVSQYIQGVLKPEIIDSIERYLENLPEYIPDEDEDELTNETKRVSGRIYRHLVKTGWLSVEQEGYDIELILLSPTVSQLLANLNDIAINNPVFFGGKIQAIYNTVEQSVKNPEDQAMGFHTVCDDARSFSRSLNSIAVRIGDIHGEITGSSDPKSVLKSFFGDFVSKILVADYKKLKTENHPFRYRADILRVAQQIQYDDDLRTRYIKGYAQQFDDAEIKFDNDISMLVAIFSNIDHQLDRIDNIKISLEKRVYGLIRFMDKTSDLESVDIKNAITSISNHGEDVFAPVLLDEFGAESRLFKPRKFKEPPKPRTVREKGIPDKRLALEAALKNEANNNRAISSDKLIAYIQRNMQKHHSISSDDLMIESISDLCAFLVLMNLSLDKLLNNLPMKPFFECYKLTRIPSQETENDYFIVPKIIITRIKSETHHAQ